MKKTNDSKYRARVSLVKAFAYSGKVPTEEQLNVLMNWIENGAESAPSKSRAEQTPALRVYPPVAPADARKYDRVIIQSPDFLWPEDCNGRRRTKCLNALNSLNIMTIGDLRKMSRTRLLSCSGVGKLTVDVVADALKNYGIKW